MPIIASAKKRVRSSRKAAIRNRKTKNSLKQAVKAFRLNLGTNKSKASASHAKAQSSIDKALKNRVIHKNKAARQKRQLARAAKAAKVSLSSKTVTKAPVKKTTAKKATPKKK